MPFLFHFSVIAFLTISKFPHAFAQELCLSECMQLNQPDALFAKEVAEEICAKKCTEPTKRRPRLKYGSTQPAAPPHNPAVLPSGNNLAFILIEPMLYEIGSTGVVIQVPAGFVTDYASIPRKLWGVYSPHDYYSRAAIVHDYLYWSQLCTRNEADNLFMIAMKESAVPEVTRNNIYWAVRTGGESAWNKNREERAAKMPKVIPVQNRNFPPNWTWDEYRKYLINNGVSDPNFSGNEYCSLGESFDIPANRPDEKKFAKKITDVKLEIRPKW